MNLVSLLKCSRRAFTFLKCCAPLLPHPPYHRHHHPCRCCSDTRSIKFGAYLRLGSISGISKKSPKTHLLHITDAFGDVFQCFFEIFLGVVFFGLGSEKEITLAPSGDLPSSTRHSQLPSWAQPRDTHHLRTNEWLSLVDLEGSESASWNAVLIFGTSMIWASFPKLGVPCLEHLEGCLCSMFAQNSAPNPEKGKKRTPNHKHPNKHGDGHCTAAQLDPHGGCQHTSVLGGLQAFNFPFGYPLPTETFLQISRCCYRYLQFEDI